MTAKTAIKSGLKNLLLKTLWRFDAAALTSHLQRLGIEPGDTLIVHASWRTDSGFSGTPLDMITSLKVAIGSEGLLVMTSMPYQNESSRDFLQRKGSINIRRSPSKMGLLTEVFRRNAQTVRSLSPTHPLLASGPEARTFIEGHEAALVPFGPDSPFQKLLDRNAKILCIGAPFSTVTFSHFVEDRIAPYLPYSLYEKNIFQGVVIDTDNNEQSIPVKVLSSQANRLRREERYVAALEQAGAIKCSRIGNCRLLLLECRDMVDVAETMYRRGQSFFDVPE
ncbi:AAC(3) family N-acetyltransferase [Motiliproteus sp. SC1-56]|uniref:AAC(3) family N-acetyltransferase n=1 Tax=Motiliproteus sp. SC1-56 TaxID=2799565 RepID=UPI001A8ECA8D|nr:AAC(3) family N-acetyltransferase [Motiliproteus sp. SC1-56]